MNELELLAEFPHARAAHEAGEAPLKPINITIRATPRGFLIGEFRDSYDHICTIQESSSVLPHLWLGVGDNRMHLTQEMALALLPLLSHFVGTGRLPEVAK